MVQILKFEVGKGFPVPDCVVPKECSWRIGKGVQKHSTYSNR